jgi:hypothetical protein
MRYLATNVRIYEGENSRGKYNWIGMQLFNDANPAANPVRLPSYYIMQPRIVEAFMACTDALTLNEGGWYDVDMSKVPDSGLTKHHLNLIRPEIVTLDGFYQQVYTRNYTDSNGATHQKGDVRLGRNGKPLAPVNAIRVYVQYMKDEDFGDLIPVETKEQIAQGVLERGYVKLQPAVETVAAMPEPEPEEDEPSVEDKRAALQAQLDALK